MSLLQTLRSFLVSKPLLEDLFTIERPMFGPGCRDFVALDRRRGQRVFLRVQEPSAQPRRSGTANHENEVRIGRAVRHPLIVQPLGHGVARDGRAYVVLEYFEGYRLQQILASSSAKLTGHRLEILRQAARALAHVHACGYLHRDISSHNFLVSPNCKALRLSGFSLAIPAKGTPSGRTASSKYAAPEVLRRQAVDQRADIFSFGMLAYEICCGRLPSGQSNGPRRSSIQFEPVQASDLQNLRPQMEPRLTAAIVRCIQPDLAQRTARISDFLDEVVGLTEDDF